MSYAEICAAVEMLKHKYEESNPFRICRDMGIVLIPRRFGTDPDSVKGFFLESKRIRTITYNVDLPLIIQKTIVAHELGHAVLHRDCGVHAFHDVAMYDSTYHLKNEAGICHAFMLPTLPRITRHC